MADINGLRLYPEGAISSIASAIKTFRKNNSDRSWSGPYTVSQMASSIDSSLFLGGTEASIINKAPFGSYSLTVDNCSYIRSYIFTGLPITYAEFPSCTSIGGYGFSGCSSLSAVSFPKCLSIGSYAFQGCSSLTTASFPSCTSIGSYAFRSCSSLTTVSFPKCTYVGGYAFYSCSTLTSAEFPACTTIVGNAFMYCYSLSMASFANCTTIQAASNFTYCSSLLSAYLPKALALPSNLFRYCYILNSGAFNAASTISAYTFGYCSSLTTLSFPKLTYIYSTYCFRSCFRLVSLYLMSTSVVTLSNSNAFTSTPIGGYSTTAGQYGSIYVPSSLLASYKAATNWVNLSARIVGV